jgi:hypothetical protein
LKRVSLSIRESVELVESDEVLRQMIKELKERKIFRTK